jgi:hypothetical protein
LLIIKGGFVYKTKGKNMEKIQNKNEKKLEQLEKKAELEKQKTFIENLKSNAELQSNLKLAFKNTVSLNSVLLPKIANSLKNYILEFQGKLDKKVNLDTANKFIQQKALTEHCYSLVEYNRKDGINHAFEMVVSRAIKLALMLVRNPEKFQKEKQNKVLIASNIATPFITETLEGQKARTRKVKNTDTKLVEVNTGIIDRIHRETNPVKTRQVKSADLSQKMTDNFKALSKQFLQGLKQAIGYAEKKNVKFFDMLDEQTWENLSSIHTLLNGQSYQVARTFSVEYEVNLEGNLEKKKTA